MERVLPTRCTCLTWSLDHRRGPANQICCRIKTPPRPPERITLRACPSPFTPVYYVPDSTSLKLWPQSPNSLISFGSHEQHGTAGTATLLPHCPRPRRAAAHLAAEPGSRCLALHGLGHLGGLPEGRSRSAGASKVRGHEVTCQYGRRRVCAGAQPSSQRRRSLPGAKSSRTDLPAPRPA